jgi:hypothetical protein
MEAAKEYKSTNRNRRKRLDASNLQNQKNQDWKRAEFIASKIKEFYRDPIVVKVIQMIDYTDRRYDIGAKKSGLPCLTRITHSQADADKLHEPSVAALETALRTAEGYTDEEATIRDYFDTFLYYVERFERFLKLKLIDPDEIFPYLRYYVHIFNGKLDHVDPGMLRSFRTYLKDFHFEDADYFFFERFKEQLAAIKRH